MIRIASRVAVTAMAMMTACASGEVPAPVAPQASVVEDAAGSSSSTPADPVNGPPIAEAQPPSDAPAASSLPDEPSETDLENQPAEQHPVIDLGESWQRGSTHVHARPSGDSSTPIAGVIKWYERHGYDFIFLTDHNRVSEADAGADTRGKVWLRSPKDKGLIVFAGSELTNNPDKHCIPAGDRGKCRIHVNVLGPTARPTGKIEWADRKNNDRVAKYQAALNEANTLHGVAQMNHPQWFWGTDVDLVAELVRRGVKLMEVANAQFPKWNAGDATHPSTEALWDGALMKGLTLWGVASDDAHDYGDKRGKWPAGGGWIAVRAKREPQAIFDAIMAGHFYASTGIVLEHAEVVHGELVVSVAPSESGSYVIEMIENGSIVDSARGRELRRAVPATGYVRAVVTRDDGKKAWTQPARMSSP